jgi:LCCL domain
MAASGRHGPASLRLLGLLLPLAYAFALASAVLAPAPAVHELDWRTSPLDLNLRGLNGERFRFHCPPGKPLPGQVIGSGPYADGSSICAAATHTGVIRAASGGLVTIEIRPGQTHFVGSLSHYVQSESYQPFWSGSFLVVAPDAAMPRPDPRARAPSSAHPTTTPGVTS